MSTAAEHIIYPELYARIDPVEYSVEAQQQLVVDLEHQARHAGLEPINSPDQILLDAQTGRTVAGKFRYTALGFSQVSSELASGLGTLVPTLWGVTRDAGTPEHFYDHNAAITVFNTVVGTRFDGLAGKNLVVHHKDKLIEGVVGPSYRTLDNASFFATVQDVMRDSQFDVVFHRAILVGRRLAVQFRSKKPLFIHTVGEKKYSVYIGYYYRNGETKGTSVRAARTLVTEHGTALWPYRPGKATRAVHTGSNFNDRVERVMQGVLIEDMKYVLSFKQCMATLTSTALELGSTVEEREARINDLANRLMKKSLPKWATKEIVEQAVYRGHTGSTPVPDARAYAERTDYDIFAALLSYAPRFGVERREKVEQLAFELLRGNLKLR
jgi:hypothetical protein